MGKLVYVLLCVLLVGCAAPARATTTPAPTMPISATNDYSAAPASGNLTLVEFFAIT